MLKQMTIKNYRTFRDVTIDFSQLTVIVGKNRVGKTTLLKILDSFYRGVELKSSGEHLYSSLGLSGKVTDDAGQFDFRYDYLLDETGLKKFTGNVGYVAKTTDNTKEAHDDASITHDQDNPSTSARSPSEVETCREVSIAYTRDAQLNPRQRRCSLVNWTPRDILHSPKFLNLGMVPARKLVRKSLGGYYYIPVSRHIENKTSHLTDEPSEKSKINFTEYNVYSSLMYDNDKRDKVIELLDEILDTKVELSLEGDKSVSAQTERNHLKINIVDDGSSIHSLLYMLTQIVFAPDHTTVMIDEPELSLYPKKQKVLFESIHRYAKERNIQLIMTTHSIHMIQTAYDFSNEGVSVLNMTLDKDSTNVKNFDKGEFSELMRSDFMDWGGGGSSSKP